MTRSRLLFVVVLGLVVGVFAIAAAQNADQAVTLRLDLGSAVGAWKLADPVPVLPLAGGALLVGLLLAPVLRGLWSFGAPAPQDFYGDGR